jgi:hypothetical protein
MLRPCTSKERDWGDRYNLVKDGVNLCCYIDIKATWFLITVHDFANELDHWKPAQKRPAVSLTYGKPDVRSDIAEEEEKQSFLLPFPAIAVDYNQGMNRADLCAQVWSYYTTAKQPHRRNWWPLLWALLDGMVANTGRICHQLESKLTHRQIQIHLAYHLLRNPANQLRKRASKVIITGARPSKISNPEGQHTWGRTSSWGVQRGNCKGCAKPMGRPYGALGKMKALGKRDSNSRIRHKTTSSRKGCLECRAALCSSSCWTKFHSRTS